MAFTSQHFGPAIRLVCEGKAMAFTSWHFGPAIRHDCEVKATAFTSQHFRRGLGVVAGRYSEDWTSWRKL
jgi:hypothetical protein